VGEPAMRRVFAAAAANSTAYAGAVAPERSRLPNDWRRFVDLVEQAGGGTGIAELVAPWALSAADRALLPARGSALAAYRSLVARDGGWAAPTVVRMALDGWDFAAAASAIASADGVVDRRDAIEKGAATERLTLPAKLEAAFEGAASADDLAVAARVADELSASLGVVAAADAAVSAPRDWVASLGLGSEDPDAQLASARAAWEAGDTATATAAAGAASSELARASDAGRLRAFAIGVGVLGAILLLAVVLRVARGRRHGPANVAAAREPEAETGPYATLPPSATAGPPPEPPATVADEGAEPT
jgi:hypothetical protein